MLPIVELFNNKTGKSVSIEPSENYKEVTVTYYDYLMGECVVTNKRNIYQSDLTNYDKLAIKAALILEARYKSVNCNIKNLQSLSIILDRRNKL